MTIERRSVVTFCIKGKNQAKWTKRDKKREIKCKKSRKRKKGLTKRVKSDKINKSPRERAIKNKRNEGKRFGRTEET